MKNALEIITVIEDKEAVDLANIYINNNLILSVCLIHNYCQPPSNLQSLEIEAQIIRFNDDGNPETISSVTNNVNLNYVDTNPETIDQSL